MAKLTVNIGQSANDRTGDNLRTAFNKINTNFTEVYNDIVSLNTLVSANITGGSGNSLNSDIVGDDSTIIVNTSTNTVTATLIGSLVGDVKGSVFADDSTKLVDAVEGLIVGDVENTNVTTTNLFANVIDSDDSSAINITPAVVMKSDLTVEGELVGYIKLSALKSVVAASTNFADFQSRIAAL